MNVFDFSYELPSTIEELDKFNGKEFEIFLFKFFQELGYSTRMTDDTNDKGIDLIVKMPIEQGTKNVGIQAKRWKSKVGADEVRSMLDGREHYSLNEIWIVTTSDLTSAAKTTAMNNKIEIINRDRVKIFLEELKKRENVKFRQNKSIKKQSPVIPTSENLEKDDNDPFFIDLKKLRSTISKEHKIYPIYFVYNNATIKEIILEKPENLEELKNISGLGDQKINLFGTQIIEVVKKYLVNKDVEIKNELFLLRKKISKYNKLNNEYSAYNDNVLDELVKLLPITIEDLKGIKGFKEENIQLFGQYLIKSIIEIKSKYLKWLLSKV